MGEGWVKNWTDAVCQSEGVKEDRMKEVRAVFLLLVLLDQCAQTSRTLDVD
jgi:hypothetical protein